MRIWKTIKNENGIAFVSVIGVVAIVTMLSITAAFLTHNELIKTRVQSESTVAFNIAEAGVERALSIYGQDYPSGSVPANNTLLYGNQSLNGGTYSTYYMQDPDRPGNILITSTGSFDGHNRTIQVSVRGVPMIFNYAFIANGNMEFEGNIKGTGYGLINGKVHSNGDMNLEGGHFFLNTVTYQGENGWENNPYYNVDYKTTAVGNIVPNNSNYVGNYDPTNKEPIDFPKIDVDFYFNQANFADQKVFVYSGGQKNWTVAEINNTFAPPAPYTSSIIIFTEGGINITGGGTITATLISGASNDVMKDIEIFADKGKVINLMPAISPAICARDIELAGDINIGTQEAGAIIIAKREIEIEGQWNNASKNQKQSQTSHIIMHGTIALGDSDAEPIEMELDGPDNAKNVLQIHYTKTILDRLPAGWENWGETMMYKDNWKED